MLAQTRKIKSTRRSVSGIYSFRGESAIPYESTLERDFVVRKEFCRSVLEVISQPCEIPFIARNGRQYTYTPDFLVYYRLGDRAYLDFPQPVLVEVKLRAEWQKNWRTWLPKWKAAYRYAKSQGWVFHIQDESRIRDQALANINFLSRFKRMSFSAEESRWVLDSLRELGSAPMHFLLARHFMGIYRAQGVAHIWHLLASRQLDCDISLPLDEQTVLWVSGDE